MLGVGYSTCPWMQDESSPFSSIFQQMLSLNTIYNTKVYFDFHQIGNLCPDEPRESTKKKLYLKVLITLPNLSHKWKSYSENLTEGKVCIIFKIYFITCPLSCLLFDYYHSCIIAKAGFYSSCAGGCDGTYCKLYRSGLTNDYLLHPFKKNKKKNMYLEMSEKVS